MRGRRPRVLGVLALAAALSACDGGAPGEAQPLGEVLLVVDTDAPVPALVGRLRVDLWTLDGTWYATRDLAAFKPSDWPVSFGVTLGDGDPAKDVVVRLRAYPEGKTRDYRGERLVSAPDPASFCSQAVCFASPLTTDGLPPCCPTAVPAVRTPFATADCPQCPRLEASGQDVTPPTEPLPGVTIDALVAVHVARGVRGAARVLLRSACFGTMADVYGLRACVDTAGLRVDVNYATLDPDLTVSPSPKVGTWGAPVPCTAAPRAPGHAPDGTPLFDDEVCVPGGAFVMGGAQGAEGIPSDDLPERVASVAPFLLDRYEVTVSRFRHALAAGFTGGAPVANPGPITSSSGGFGSPSQCTWSDAPLGREAYPVTCISHDVARAFCRFEGGDLPSEAQWEYAAAVAGRPGRTTYPWGDGDGQDPSCSQIVYARFDNSANDVGRCFGAAPAGPAPVTSQPGDITPLGIVGLGGNVAEMTRDMFASLGAACWLAAATNDPLCQGPGPATTWRGGAWDVTSLDLQVTRRGVVPTPSVWGSGVGLRCVRPGAP
jgi:formylglycine-generating enzyme required for sulfatase activity